MNHLLEKEPDEKDTKLETDLSFWTTQNKMKSFIVSLFSLFLFLVPVPYQNQWTIGIGIIAEALQTVFENYLPPFMTLILVLSLIGSVITNLVYGISTDGLYALNL
ncbi:hypothetical protein ACE1TI_15230 [Alteribacillus sp. JSM 102045]|uniref:hypothetical protein n=1 Tax=Alteribacillus sp. JSM 102045 TaxID=1562101 RepID=UPI0035BFCDE7